MNNGFARKRWLAALALVALLLSGTGSAEASFGRITGITGMPELSGSREAYRVTLIASEQTSLALSATAAATATDNGGTRIRWSVTPDSGSTASVSLVPYDGISQVDVTGAANCVVRFANPGAGDRYTVTAQLEDSLGNKIGANAVVKVSFLVPVALTGVTLDRTSVTIRQGGRPVYLKATPITANATSVSYTWSSQKPSIATLTQMLPLSPDVALVTGSYPGYSAQVQVQASSYGGALYTATCEVNVADTGEVADDMKLSPVMGKAEEIAATGLYAVDAKFVRDVYALDAPDIASLAGMEGSPSVRFLLGSADISPMPMLSVDRDAIMGALGVTNYKTSTAAALKLDLPFEPPMKKGDMVPFVLSFKLDDLRYPDGNTSVGRPASPEAFANDFRLVKYFQRDNTRYSIDVSEILMRRSTADYIRFVGGNAQITPLLVFVDGVAPANCDKRAGENNEFGVKYVANSKLLFIYDGNANTAISDPLVLERRSSGTGSGGGGGGCDTGTGLCTVVALLGIAATFRRGRNERK